MQQATFQQHSEQKTIARRRYSLTINVTMNATFDAMLLQKKTEVLELLQFSLQTPNLRLLDPIPI